jgi:homogentisate 1,2-dioxygenase
MQIFDVVGWDGYNFPWFSIHNFEPIIGRVHQPPPVHQTYLKHPLLWSVHLYQGTIIIQKQFPPYNHSNVEVHIVLDVDGDLWVEIILNNTLHYIQKEFLTALHLEQ